jgi:hypothetical protein
MRERVEHLYIIVLTRLGLWISSLGEALFNAGFTLRRRADIMANARWLRQHPEGATMWTCPPEVLARIKARVMAETTDAT